MTVSDRLWSAAAAAASRFDRLPVSPSSLGERLLDVHLDRRRARAATDPEWAEIEGRRRTSHGGSILLSDDLDLTHWAIQSRIEDELSPDPAWLPLVHAARDARASRLVASARAALQRVRRGWADEDVWDLRSTHARVLGEQLLHLAGTAHGWPCGPEFETFEDWTAALHHHGTVLSRQGWTGVSADESLDRWHSVATDPTATESERDEADRLHDSEEEDALARVTASLHWVADHHALLWD